MIPVAITRRCFSPILSRWGFDPFRELDRLSATLFAEEPKFAVRLDVREDDGHYYVEADLPGFSKEDVEVTFEDGVLTLSGERKDEESDQDANYHHTERRTGKFSRSVRLPEGVKQDTLGARLKDGVLTITVAKVEETKPRRIEVKGQ